MNFKWTVLGSFRKPLTRQITEAVKIRGNQGQQNLNSKNEFNAQKVQKIVIERSKPKYDCSVCGRLFESEREKEQHEVKFHRVLVCEICKETVYGERALQEHINNIHS